MEPTPPRKPKDNRPFYAPPEDKPIAVQIINEARLSLKDIKTKRPFTPREDQRTLFGSRSVGTSQDSRPPSAFSLDSRHFDPDSRPVSGTRLSPLDHKPLPSLSTLEDDVVKIPSEAEVESLLLPPRPPNDPNKPAAATRKSSRTRLHHANSVDTSPPVDNIKGRSNSLTDVSSSISQDSESSGLGKRLTAGPVDSPAGERGEGDGKESSPLRAASSAAVNSPPTSALSRREREVTLNNGSVTRDGEERVHSGGSKRTVRSKDGEERVHSGGTKRTASAGSTGRGGSAGRREEETQDDVDFYEQHIEPVLQEMSVLSKNKDVKNLCALSDALHATLVERGLLVKNYRQRSRILKAIFKMLDMEEPKLLLRLARLILAFKVGGNNLLNVCKLVFKVSRNEKNDPAFLEGNILELLLDVLPSADVQTTHEALIYCIGSLKFLTGNSKIAKYLVKKDCIEKLAGLLHSINKVNRDNGKINDQLGHILVQLTAALRNLADATSSRDRLLNCRVLDGLCVICDSYTGDGEIVLNISRIFSKVTLHTDCCMALAETPTSYRVFLQLLKKHMQKEDIVVRVCFILGNMTAKNDDARIRLFQESKSTDILFTVLKTYMEIDIRARDKEEKKENQSSRGDGDSSKDISKTEDVLIKVVRVIANISINEMVGPQIASSQTCIDLLHSILDYKDIAGSEELVLNTVATINNLSYYSCKTSAITANQIKLLEGLMKLVLSESMMKCIVEVSRVFGNLTRQKVVRDFLTDKKVDVLLITLLDSGDKEVVYIACGVLINIMVDEEKRAVLKLEGGITKLVEVLRDFGRGDWELAAMVCQTLWNYSGKITSTSSAFGDQDSQELIELLIDLLDKESAFDGQLNEMDEDYQEYVVEAWENQFCPVAEQLLHRLESHQSKFDSLPT